MNKTVIKVPKGIRFLSDWNDFNFKNFPLKCIINKQLPGCGFTEWCIRNDHNTIITSPRKLLIYNKWEQHKKEVFLVVNEMEKDVEIDKDISEDLRSININRRVISKITLETKEEIDRKDEKEKEDNRVVFEKIRTKLLEFINLKRSESKPIKILVTYDSFRIVKDILIESGIFNSFYVVVDEFQSILHDSRFKSSTELQFMHTLSSSPTAFFASATPMLEDYLDMLDEFKDLPYYELDWASLDPGRITIPKLDVKVMRTVTEEACKVIKEFLDGKYEEVTIKDGNSHRTIVSNKIVLYMNSVKHIITIIKRLDLRPDQINILCSKTEENEKKIRTKLGKKYVIGKVPLENEPEPDITFCTRTVYLGADFYSKCARTFVFSDANIDSLAVDISEDLPQILGRQRLEENPWKNQAYFYYRSTVDYRGLEKEDFDRFISKKMERSKKLLRAIDNNKEEDLKDVLADNYLTVATLKNYQKDYIGVNKIKDSITGRVTLVPKINQLVYVSEMRAFRIQQIDYKDRFTVFAAIHNKFYSGELSGEVGKESGKTLDFLRGYQSQGTISDRLRYLCECPDRGLVDSILSQISDTDIVKYYISNLGVEKIKALGYNVTYMKKQISIITFNPLVLENLIYQDFHEGDKLSSAEIKERLGKIYEEAKYKATPKATDISKYFEANEVSFYIEDLDNPGKKKKCRGFELLKKK